MCSARPKGDTVIQELLAVVKFFQHFCSYLLGHHFIAWTDHGSLTRLCNFKNSENKLARWLEQLQEYEFEIVHRPATNTATLMGCTRSLASSVG